MDLEGIPSFLFRLEFLWIPIILYGLAALIALTVFLWLKLRKDDNDIEKLENTSS